MVVQPDDLPVFEIVHVELLKVPLNLVHIVWNHAFWSVLKWPMTTRENFSLEFNIIDQFGTLVSPISVLSHGLLTFLHIFKHCFDLVHCVVTAFNLQLFNHQ